jgi:hypothetical protein
MATKRITVIKNRSDEAFNASLPCFITVNTIYIHAEIALKLGKTLGNTYAKAKTTMFSSFATASTKKKITNFLGNCQWNSSLHCFYALIFFFVKALRK